MIPDAEPWLQGLLGGVFTWFMTALGAAVVFLYWSPKSTKLLDMSLGFAAGVMTAASFWSLLAPAVYLSEAWLGRAWAWLPVVVGFTLGCLFVYATDVALAKLGYREQSVADYLHEQVDAAAQQEDQEDQDSSDKMLESAAETSVARHNSLRRVLLLIVAVVVHNVPEGVAVGLTFGAIGQTPSNTYANALTLAVGMGIQNLPEGMAVSLPLVGFGYSRWRAFFYGQLSGAVEPAAALVGALTIQYMTPILPWALSFAAGCMIYVVFDDIVPAGREHGHGKLATGATMAGFIVMMCLDVALGGH